MSVVDLDGRDETSHMFYVGVWGCAHQRKSIAF